MLYFIFDPTTSDVLFNMFLKSALPEKTRYAKTQARITTTHKSILNSFLMTKKTRMQITTAMNMNFNDMV